MTSPASQRKHVAVWIGSLALLGAIAIGVWATRTERNSIAAAAPVRTSTGSDADREDVALVAPRPESIPTSEVERTATPDAMDSRDGVPFERGTHIVFTVSSPDNSLAYKADLRFAQLVANHSGGAPAWKFTSGQTDGDGRFEYELPRRREVYSLRVFALALVLAANRADTSREVELRPPFPKQLALQLSAAGSLSVRVTDDAGEPVRGLPVNLLGEVLDTAWTDELDGDDELTAPGVPISSATIAQELASGPVWPLMPAEPHDPSTTDEWGVARFMTLRPGTWRVRLRADTTPAAQFPEARIWPSESTQLVLRLGRATDTLAVEGLIVDEHERPLPRRALVVQVARHPQVNVESDALGAFREWSSAGERVTVEPQPEHPSEQFDPPYWEGPRGARGIVFRRKTAGEWANVTLRVVERSTRLQLPWATLEYEITLRSNWQRTSRMLNGERSIALPVAEGLQISVFSPGFASYSFPSTELRERAAKGGVLVIALDREAAPILEKK